MRIAHVCRKCREHLRPPASAPLRVLNSRRGTLRAPWISGCKAAARSCSAPRRGWASRSPRRSSPRARTWRCSPAAPTSSSARRRASAPSLGVGGDLTRRRRPRAARRRHRRRVRRRRRRSSSTAAALRRAPPTDVTAEAVTAAVELLLVPHVRLVGLCLPHLRASGRGRIVAIESTSVKEPIANLALSNAVRPGRRRLAEDARQGARPRRHHRQHDRARADRHRAAAGPLRRRRPAARGARADPRTPDRLAGRDRRDRVLPRLRAGRVRQRRRRARSTAAS